MKKEIRTYTRTYTSMTHDLLRLKKWLQEAGITHLAMESTGVYWKPFFNILEDNFEVILVNARHVKNVPGRKTDVQDSEWLCKLLRSGLVVFFRNMVTNSLPTAETQSSQRGWFFCSGGERPPEQKGSASSRQKRYADLCRRQSGCFYPDASHGRIKETFHPPFAFSVTLR